MRVGKTMWIPWGHMSIQELTKSYDAGDMRVTMHACVSRPHTVWVEIDECLLGAFLGVIEL